MVKAVKTITRSGYQPRGLNAAAVAVRHMIPGGNNVGAKIIWLETHHPEALRMNVPELMSHYGCQAAEAQEVYLFIRAEHGISTEVLELTEEQAIDEQPAPVQE